jgi:hypothetical protein
VARLDLLLAVALAAACAAPTGYGPRGPDGGYTQDRLPDGTILVSFEGNEDTPSETVKRFLRLRCAEVAVQEGAAAYVVVESNSLQMHVAAGLRGGDRGAGRGRVAGGGGGGPGHGNRSAPSGEVHVRPVETARIRLVPAGAEGAVDVRAQLKALDVPAGR